MNLLDDPWIPVVCQDGQGHVIAPWQIADRRISRLDWPRADLNIACLELLIGLVFMADPPEDIEDWDERRAPDADRLRAALEPFAPAFDLLGEGPRFCQDRAELEGKPNPVDMLFVDSVGEATVKKNADLMVWRDRYGALDPGLAAMALYTMQAFAPSGGAGNRTSMRGGGPMVTLVAPEGGALWDVIWANVPEGAAAAPSDLPWMVPTVTSEKGTLPKYPEQAHPVEAFFGMPRRLRLVEEDGAVMGVLQRPYGTNYAGWDHPLTPYYRVKLESEWLPKHPRAGRFGYPNWLGVVVAQEQDSGRTRRARAVQNWRERGRGRPARVIVAGWAMDNMKPRDFILSTPPLLDLTPAEAEGVAGMVAAADLYSLALRTALASVLAEGEAREAVREAFYLRTQEPFEAALTAPVEGRAQGWLAQMRRVALELFEARALPGLADRDTKAQAAIVQAHRNLANAFRGLGSYGKKAFEELSLPVPAKPKKQAKSKAKERAT